MKKVKTLACALMLLFGTTVAANAEVVLLLPGDFVGITFWLLSMAMIAATVFFFIECGRVAVHWRLPVTVSGIVTGVAFINYMHIRGIWVQTGDLPTIYRYAEWIVTFPLLAAQFYFVLAAVRKVSSLVFWRLLLAALVMTISEYLGEAGYLQSFIAFVIGMIGWIYILFEIFSGEAFRLSGRSGNKPLLMAFSTMRMIVTIGWAIYPLGYIFGYLTGGIDSNTLNVEIECYYLANIIRTDV